MAELHTLVFSEGAVPAVSPHRLIFGQSTETEPEPIADVALGLVASITGLRGVATVRYASNTARPMVCSVDAPWQEATRVQMPMGVDWHQSQAQRLPLAASSTAALPVREVLGVVWRDTERVRAAVRSAYQAAQPVATDPLTVRYQDALRGRTAARSRYQAALPVSVPPLRVGYQDTLRLRSAAITSYQRAIGRAEGVSERGQRALPRQSSLDSQYQRAMRAPIGISFVPPPKPDEPCYVPPNGLHVELVFSEPWQEASDLIFVCERHGAGPDPEPEAEIVIPVRRYYVVINDITLRRVDGNYELRAYGFSMAIDKDSWTWSFSATLRSDALPYLEPGSRSEPVELEATINGQPYRLQVEKIGRDTQFGAVRIRISGRGRAAILAAPYAPVLNFGNSAPRTAQQLMADVLTINGVSIGWDVDWGLVDWPVPAGAWAMQGSYIDAITDIAAAAGGYVQPHATDATLRILSSYPKPPWEWDTITPDIELPAAAASVESIEWVDMPAYNRVFAGGVSKGVFGPFTRAGTAGNLIAPQVTHALITHADAHRQRGLAELSNTGRQAHYQLKTQVMPETGIIVPGKFVRYVGGAPVIGIVRSTSLDWSRPVMRQTIGVETHVAA